MLPDIQSLLVFLAATLMLNFTPGPDMLYVIANGVGRGQRAGVVSALAIGVGGMVHTLAAALGLSALLMSSALAYDVVRYAGAAYLLYLGFKTIRGKGASIPSQRLPQEKYGRVFRQGVATAALNPKVALFFLAFIPQFVDPSRGSVVLQFLLLGGIFNTSGTLVNTGVALGSGAVGERISRSSGFSRAQQWFTGGVFMALGARIALASPK